MVAVVVIVGLAVAALVGYRLLLARRVETRRVEANPGEDTSMAARPRNEALERTTREVLEATIGLGAMAADAVIREKFPDAVRLHPDPESTSRVAYRFWSLLYRAGDVYVVVETFAGHSQPGIRFSSSGSLEQGARPYLEDQVLYGTLTGDEHVAAVKAALAEGRVRYFQVRLPIVEREGRSSAEAVHVSEYAL